MQLAPDIVVSVERAVAQLKSHGVQASPNRGKRLQGVPAKDVVVPVGFPATGLDYGNARKQSPIEMIIVGCMYEIFSRFNTGQ